MRRVYAYSAVPQFAFVSRAFRWDCYPELLIIPLCKCDKVAAGKILNSDNSAEHSCPHTHAHTHINTHTSSPSQACLLLLHRLVHNEIFVTHALAHSNTHTSFYCRHTDGTLAFKNLLLSLISHNPPDMHTHPRSRETQRVNNGSKSTLHRRVLRRSNCTQTRTGVYGGSGNGSGVGRGDQTGERKRQCRKVISMTLQWFMKRRSIRNDDEPLISVYIYMISPLQQMFMNSQHHKKVDQSDNWGSSVLLSVNWILIVVLAKHFKMAVS